MAISFVTEGVRMIQRLRSVRGLALRFPEDDSALTIESAGIHEFSARDVDFRVRCT